MVLIKTKMSRVLCSFIISLMTGYNIYVHIINDFKNDTDCMIVYYLSYHTKIGIKYFILIFSLHSLN